MSYYCEICEVLLPSNSTSIYRKEDPITRTSGDKLLHTKSTTADDLKL